MIKINAKIFREYDIRGIVDEDLSDIGCSLPDFLDHLITLALAGK